MPYPLSWLQRTFTSRSRTEELLRPELENGLTPHDFELAQKFLPGPSSVHVAVAGLLSGSSAAAYVRLCNRPPWSLARTSFVAVLAGLSGAIFTQFQHIQAHRMFVQSLQNPSTFMQALENVNRRAGGVEPLGFTLRNAKLRREDTDADVNGSDPSGIEFVQDGHWDDPENSSVMSKTSKGALAALPTPPSRWGQIRAANARAAAQNSSWDALRQKHERERVQNSARYNEREVSEGRLPKRTRFDTVQEESTS